MQNKSASLVDARSASYSEPLLVCLFSLRNASDASTSTSRWVGLTQHVYRHCLRHATAPQPKLPASQLACSGKNGQWRWRVCVFTCLHLVGSSISQRLFASWFFCNSAILLTILTPFGLAVLGACEKSLVLSSRLLDTRVMPEKKSVCLRVRVRVY